MGVPQKTNAATVPTITAAKKPAEDLRDAKGGDGRGGVLAPYNLPKVEAAVSAHESLVKRSKEEAG